MIKMTYAQLNDYNLTNALSKLASFSGFGVRTAYQLGKINERVARELVIAKKLYLDTVLTPHVVKDEAGEIQFYTDGPKQGQPKIDPKQQESYDKAYEAFLAHVIDFGRNKVEAVEVEKAGLSGRELIALEPVLDGLESFLTDAHLADVAS